MVAWLAAVAGGAVGPAAASMSVWLPDSTARPRSWWLGTPASKVRVIATSLACAAVCGLLAWRLGPQWATVAYLGAGTGGVLTAITDTERFLIADKVTYPLYAWVAAWLCLDAGLTGRWSSLVSAALAAAALGIGGLAIAFAFPGKWGLGDCKLLGVLGALMGWFGWFPPLLGLMLGLLIGLVCSLTLAALGWRRLGTDFPLGPALLAGAFLSVMLTSS